MRGETLHIERTFQASAEVVFDAWTSEEVLRRWFRAKHDWETPEAKVDLRLGGAVRVVMRNPHKDAEHGGGGHYTEIDPPLSGGTTTVRMTHSGLRDQESVLNHEDGWAGCFDNLDRTLAS
jgi:uncharacterized protein YndB with AHSA1/START domain